MSVTLYIPARDIEVGDVIHWGSEFAFVSKIEPSEHNYSRWFTLEFADGSVLEQEYPHEKKLKKPRIP